MNVRRTLATAGMLATLLSARPALAQTPEAKTGARALFKQGNEAFGQKRWAEALDFLTRAEGLVHAPTHVLLIGRAHRELGHLVRAYEAFSALAHETLAPTAAKAFKEAQAAAVEELRALEPRLPTLTVTLSAAGAKNVAITMDGEPWPAELIGVARPVDPGKHTFKARAERLVSGEQTIKIDEGGKATLVLDMRPAPDDGKGAVTPPPPAGNAPAAPPSPPSKGLKIGGFVGLGLGAAGLGVGAAFTALGFAKRGEASAAFDKCGPPCVNGTAPANNVKALDASANTKQTIGLIGLIVGGALAATGVPLLVLSSRGAGPSSARLVVGPGSAGVEGAF